MGVSLKPTTAGSSAMRLTTSSRPKTVRKKNGFSVPQAPTIRSWFTRIAVAVAGAAAVPVAAAAVAVSAARVAWAVRVGEMVSRAAMVAVAMAVPAAEVAVPESSG